MIKVHRLKSIAIFFQNNKFYFKGEFHSNSWNLTFVNKLKFYDLLFLKHQKIGNRSWDTYMFSQTEIRFSETNNIV